MLNFSVLSKRRDALFGMAILSIVAFHFFLACQRAHVLSTVAGIYIALIGRVGVEVFLLLSGMGLFFSLSKNANLKDFYLKRLVRICIPYFIIATVHFFVRFVVMGNKGFAAVLRGVFFCGLYHARAFPLLVYRTALRDVCGISFAL